MDNAFAGDGSLIVHNLGHEISQCDRKVIRLRIAKGNRHGCLRVCVHQKNSLALLYKRSAQIDAARALCNAAFLVHKRCYCGGHRHTSSITGFTYASTYMMINNPSVMIRITISSLLTE